MYKLLATLLLSIIITAGWSQKMRYEIWMDDTASHTFSLSLLYSGTKSNVQFKLPVWSPGYYQRMDYDTNVHSFTATAGGEILTWKKTGNTWTISNPTGKPVQLNYKVKATRAFVASSYLGSSKAYMVPTSLFMHEAGNIKQPVEVTVHALKGWTIATGLDSIAGKSSTYIAPDFDILYDSPLLAGELEFLDVFTVKGIPHYYKGVKLGTFDRRQFIDDLKRIVETASSIIGDIPYKHYTFIAIGPGQGGIEHLNSTTVSFSGEGLNTPLGRIRILNFLAHEYFHHYNVKRIRPVELGPFDYDKGSRTDMLWVSEGLTVYYEYLVLKRAGITTNNELLKSIQSNIIAHEKKPGKQFQSLIQASEQTWSDGPFGRTNDAINKTISYYDKGPVVGLLLDFAIRNATQNKRSLDDVMRTLYKTFYQQKKRGFTSKEFWKVAEKTAGISLKELYEYTTTVAPLNYNKYLGYAGLTLDSTSGAYNISLVPQPTPLQQEILRSWMGE